MTDPKKRLKEIIREHREEIREKFMHPLNEIGWYELFKNNEKYLVQAINKKFVHKDNLPSMDEIAKLICNGRCGEGSLCLDCSIKIATVIRKLIEGKKK